MNSHCKTTITVKDKPKSEERGAKTRRLSEAIMKVSSLSLFCNTRPLLSKPVSRRREKREN